MVWWFQGETGARASWVQLPAETLDSGGVEPRLLASRGRKTVKPKRETTGLCSRTLGGKHI